MRKSIKVLIVEDEDVICSLLAEAFAEEGFVVATSPNGAVASEKLKSSRLPDVILLDWMMPVMSGVEFIKILQEKGYLKKIPVIVISALPGIEAMVESFGCQILKKPFDLDKLLKITHGAVEAA